MSAALRIPVNPDQVPFRAELGFTKSRQSICLSPERVLLVIFISADPSIEGHSWDRMLRVSHIPVRRFAREKLPVLILLYTMDLCCKKNGPGSASPGQTDFRFAVGLLDAWF